MTDNCNKVTSLEPKVQDKLIEQVREEDIIKLANDMEKKGIHASCVTGSLEKETIKAAEKIEANLIIVGREQKKNSV